jgi:prepilin-type N-terminal cleavage/methylation domain-containing protein
MKPPGIRRVAPARPRVRGAAFTLLEVMISASLMAIILTGAYACFRAGIASEKLIDTRAEIFQNARVAMALLSADLRGACPLTKEFAFLGMRRTLGEIDADNLDFATHHYTPRRPRQGDFCEVSYFLEKNPKTGQYALWRRRNPLLALEPLTGGRREEIIPGVVGLRFEYYDGWEWYNQWGDADQDRSAKSPAKTSAKASAKQETSNLEGMPEAVRITLWLDSNPQAKTRGGTATNEPPLMFQTVARLNLATAAQGLSSPGSGSTSAGPSGGGPGGSGPPPGGGGRP